MNNKKFNKGIFLTAAGSFWWGFLGVIYFKYISFVGHIEVVIHRAFWTTVTLLLTTFFFTKWRVFFHIICKKVINNFLLISVSYVVYCHALLNIVHKSFHLSI